MEIYFLNHPNSRLKINHMFTVAKKVTYIVLIISIGIGIGIEATYIYVYAWRFIRIINRIEMIFNGTMVWMDIFGLLSLCIYCPYTFMNPWNKREYTCTMRLCHAFMNNLRSHEDS